MKSFRCCWVSVTLGSVIAKFDCILVFRSFGVLVLCWFFYNARKKIKEPGGGEKSNAAQLYLYTSATVMKWSLYTHIQIPIWEFSEEIKSCAAILLQHLCTHIFKFAYENSVSNAWWGQRYNATNMIRNTLTQNVSSKICSKSYRKMLSCDLKPDQCNE